MYILGYFGGALVVMFIALLFTRHCVGILARLEQDEIERDRY